MATGYKLPEPTSGHLSRCALLGTAARTGAGLALGSTALDTMMAGEVFAAPDHAPVSLTYWTRLRNQRLRSVPDAPIHRGYPR